MLNIPFIVKVLNSKLSDLEDVPERTKLPIFIWCILFSTCRKKILQSALRSAKIFYRMVQYRAAHLFLQPFAYLVYEKTLQVESTRRRQK